MANGPGFTGEATKERVKRKGNGAFSLRLREEGVGRWSKTPKALCPPRPDEGEVWPGEARAGRGSNLAVALRPPPSAPTPLLPRASRRRGQITPALLRKSEDRPGDPRYNRFVEGISGPLARSLLPLLLGLLPMEKERNL